MHGDTPATTPFQHSAKLTARWDARCPECNLNWNLFNPVKITGQPFYRCIECKTLFPEDASHV